MLWRRPSESLHGASLIQADALIVAVNIHAILRNGESVLKWAYYHIGRYTKSHRASPCAGRRSMA